MRINVFATSVQKRSFVSGRKVRLRCFEVWISGIKKSTKMEKRRARTPPSLLGIERRMAYANRKYHSGLIWGGVTRGLAGVKLSGSPRMLGAKVDRETRAARRMAKPKASL